MGTDIDDQRLLKDSHVNVNLKRPGRKTSLTTLLAVTVASIISVSHAAAAPNDSVVLPKSAPFPESISAMADGTLFVSSIAEGGVLKIKPGALPVPFFRPGEHDTRSTFGVFVDEKAGLLWVASNDASALGLNGPSAVEGAWIKSFDLASGALKASVRLPGSPSIVNDFALGSDGALYVTNTAAPQILRMQPGAAELEVVVQDDALKGGLDGIAFGKDGTLYVNTYATGELFRIDVQPGAAAKVTKLTTSRPLTHPDALKPYKDGFVMVEGGGTLDRITIDGDKARIETIKAFAGPTGVAVTRNRVWVAEGQLAYLGGKKGLPPEGFQLRSMPLPKDAGQ